MLQIDRFLFEDVKKEFSIHKMTGFGIDGDDAQKVDDFEKVRGDFESNQMVLTITEHMKTKEELGRSVITVLNQFIHQTTKV